ncbi:MAG: helix-turn-helix domain-containing protein [Puniceicoccales bacterium]|jgi:excisionase family DNA binding protein|nr:helix-turn-helix domain-containing protein [Puniceicoccales bacterium]
MFKESQMSEPLNLGSSNSRHKLLNVEEAAEFLGIKKSTLTHWLSAKIYPGLKSIKLGGLRRFREQDLIEFIESRVCTTTVDPNPNPNSKKTSKTSQGGML